MSDCCCESCGTRFGTSRAACPRCGFCDGCCDCEDWQEYDPDEDPYFWEYDDEPLDLEM